MELLFQTWEAQAITAKIKRKKKGKRKKKRKESFESFKVKSSYTEKEIFNLYAANLLNRLKGNMQDGRICSQIMHLIMNIPEYTKYRIYKIQKYRIQNTEIQNTEYTKPSTNPTATKGTMIKKK